MDAQLFEKSVRFRQDVKRNIVTVPSPSLMYKALLDKSDSIDVATKATKQARWLMSDANAVDDFIYTAAIEYPFKTEPYMETRYSDGTHPVWYGSKTLKTSIYETVYHTKKFITAIAGYESEHSISRQSSVYDVFCDTILLDIVLNKKNAQSLISDDYAFTQTLGKEIRKHGYSGLLSPSARHIGGVNANIFKKEVLSKPTLHKSLHYVYLIDEDLMQVYDGKRIIFSI